MHLYVRILLALVAVVAASFSPALLLISGFPYPDFYHENVGYRFFQTMRFIDGAPNDFIHPGQGVLLPFIQAVYYKLLSGDLWARITGFANLTVAGGIMFMALVLIGIAIDRGIPDRARMALMLMPIVLALSHQHMLSYHLYPDYHSYEKALLLAATWLYVRAFVCRKPRFADFAALGFIAGLIASLKINIGALVLILALAQGPVIGSVLSGAVAAAVYFGLLLSYYRFNLVWVVDYFRVLFGFAHGSWQFDWGSLSPFAPWNEHTMSNLGAYFLLCAALTVLLFTSRRRLAFIIGFVALISVAMAIKRGGGGSYFDAVAVIICLCAIEIAALDKRPVATGLALAAMAANVVLWSASSAAILKDNGGMIYSPQTAWQRDLYRWTEETGLPALAIFPSNYFVAGSVDDMMMRGFSNFASPWYDSNSNPSLRKLFPNRRFGTYTAQVKRPTVIIWTEATEAFQFPDDWRSHNKKMEQIVGSDRSNCRSFHPPATIFLVLHACAQQN